MDLIMMNLQNHVFHRYQTHVSIMKKGVGWQRKLQEGKKPEKAEKEFGGANVKLRKVNGSFG